MNWVKLALAAFLLTAVVACGNAGTSDDTHPLQQTMEEESE